MSTSILIKSYWYRALNTTHSNTCWWGLIAIFNFGSSSVSIASSTCSSSIRKYLFTTPVEYIWTSHSRNLVQIGPSTRVKCIQYICTHGQSRLLFLSWGNLNWSLVRTQSNEIVYNKGIATTNFDMIKWYIIWLSTGFSVYSFPVFPLSVTANDYENKSVHF